jgi:hypothetical protein
MLCFARKILRVAGPIFLVAMCLSGGLASASPLHFSESVSGDLLSVPNAEFTFDVGVNTIAGNTHFGVNVPGHPHYDRDYDGFAFRLPVGMRLTSVGLSFATLSDNASKADSRLHFCSGLGDCGLDPSRLLDTEVVSYLSPPAVGFDFLFPLTEGIYSIIPRTMSIAAIDPGNPKEWWSSDYVWSFSVSVPEPGTLALLLFVGLLVFCPPAPAVSSFRRGK